MVDFPSFRRRSRPSGWREKIAPSPLPPPPSPSPMLRNSDLPTILEYRTNRAFGKSSGAHVLPERHQQPVNLDPVLPRQVLLEDTPSRFRARRSDESPPVGDPVNVDVDADLRSAAGNPQCEIRAFRPDAAK